MTHHYSMEELDEAALDDLRRDAEAAERDAQALQGEERDSLLAYAARCRATMLACANGGAHRAVLSGRDP